MHVYVPGVLSLTIRTESVEASVRTRGPVLCRKKPSLVQTTFSAVLRVELHEREILISLESSLAMS